MKVEQMKTNDLKKLIQTRLKTVCSNVYFEVATKEIYPHCVFEFSSIDLDDLSRDDVILTVDVWDKGTTTTAIDNLCDEIEALFNYANMPQDNILPTFYRINRNTVKDDDKSIRHRVLKFLIQNYER